MAVGAGTHLCAAYRFRSGYTATATQWHAAMEDAQTTLGGRQKTLQLSVYGRWWEQLKAGYTRVAEWLASSAPQ